MQMTKSGCKTSLLIISVLSVSQVDSATLSLAQYPLFLSSSMSPNVLVIYDNSQSMDGTMEGKLIAGSEADTRGNIARSVLRNVINNYRTQFNWGLETFDISGSPARYNTYAYYLGNEQTMAFTRSCVNGISADNATLGLRCTTNPQPVTTGNVTYNYITYDVTGDDPEINDVLYTNYSGSGAWGVKPSGASGNSSTTYSLFNNRNSSSLSWRVGNNNSASYNSSNDFKDPSMGSNPITFTPTDAGFLSSWPAYTRQFYLQRAWGYLNNVTGVGKLVASIKSDSTAHFNNLMNVLAPETNAASNEIKNAAVYTPIAGSLATAKSYFSGALSNTASPIQYTCQRNFVLLATDGNPTGKANGTQYAMSAWQDADSGQAYLDVYTQIQGLRNLSFSGRNYDIETYVIGMGDSVANPVSVTGLNNMARYGGTGTAFLAHTATELSNAFQSIATDIITKTAAASSVSLNTGSWNTGADVFQARFNSGDWSGQLLSYFINKDGSIGTFRWDSGQVLNTQSWDTGRHILTYKPSAALGSRGVAFRWPQNPASPMATEIDDAQITALNTNASGTLDGYGSQRLLYLRGNNVNEAGQCGSCTPMFRNRPTTKLGDIINSSPYYVAFPGYGYSPAMENASYTTFAHSYSGRTPVVYVGANDGMLHAFNANTGQELFAYVPSSVYSTLSQLTSMDYTHRYYVDGSPTVGDVFYAGAWHTLLVGGLRAGGQGVFTLDVTDPVHFSESNARNIVRWEFKDSHDSDLGNTYSQPLLVKTNNGRWSVIIGNGYNNTVADGYASTTGRAVLFILDAETGAVTAKIDTVSGTLANANGLSGPVAIDTNGDSIADIVYAGDLYGNLWKFDISSNQIANWKVAYSGAPLFQTGGLPITVKPDVTVSPKGGHMVVFGSGQYIATGDPATTATQRFYGIWDNGTAISNGIASLQQQSVVATVTALDLNSYRLSTHAVGQGADALLAGDNIITAANYYLQKRGWYMNLPTSGERTVTDATIRGGRVIFNTTIPSTAACSYGGSGWVMELNVNNGNRLATPTFDSNGDKQMTVDDYVSYNDKKNNTSGRFIASIPAMAAFMRPPQLPGKAPFENKYLNTSAGIISIVGETSGNSVRGRIMWQELK